VSYIHFSQPLVYFITGEREGAGRRRKAAKGCRGEAMIESEGERRSENFVMISTDRLCIMIICDNNTAATDNIVINYYLL